MTIFGSNNSIKKEICVEIILLLGGIFICWSTISFALGDIVLHWTNHLSTNIKRVDFSKENSEWGVVAALIDVDKSCTTYHLSIVKCLFWPLFIITSTFLITKTKTIFTGLVYMNVHNHNKILVKILKEPVGGTSFGDLPYDNNYHLFQKPLPCRDFSKNCIKNNTFITMVSNDINIFKVASGSYIPPR